MRNIIVLIGLISFNFLTFAQGEEVGPLTGNPHLYKEGVNKGLKVNAGTFDSTFIYYQDTIDLPIFDDFSSNKFQTYSTDFLAAGVTSDIVFRLLDDMDVPLALDVTYSSQQTFRRTYVISDDENTDVNFAPASVKIGDLSSYPVVHVPEDVYPPYYIFDTVDVAGGTDLSPDTVWIVGPDIFQESATQFFAPIVDPEKIWIESEAYHNYTLAVEPWTLGVASFDGLDENGFPYDFNSATTSYADHLTSKPIDMSGVAASDSVYMSFLYQSKGFGDQPEVTDSLILEFYAKDLQQWNTVWSVSGEALDDFKIGHIKLDNPDYFKKGFQFRFKNYGGLSGSLDHFHLDYVNLRTLSGIQDTLFKDFAFVYPVKTFIEDYTSVPWDHWKNNFSGKMSSDVEVVVRNGSDISENNQNGSSEIFYGGVSEGSFTLAAQTLSGGNINYGPRTTYYSFHDFSSGYHFDETKTGLSESFSVVTTATAQFPDFTGNDSTTTEQVFENYYSYDDGSAELAYGPTGVQSRLAIKYEAYEVDSLIGVDIHWVPSVNDVSGNLFFLTVWDDNNGAPGNVIYKDSIIFPRQPKYEFARNLFTRYYLQDTMKVEVGGTFYVGWRQVEGERLNVGLDMNIVNNDKTFFSIDGGVNWENSAFQGSVMIRPIFSTGLDVELGIKDLKEEIDALLYPNPTSGKVSIDVVSGNYQGVEVYNLQGKQIMTESSFVFDMSNQPKGIYIVKLKGSNQIMKLIKQ